MKRNIILFLALFITQLLSAQEIKVLEIKPLEWSLKARTAQVRDNNGDLCALIEVAAPKLEGLSFEENRYVGEVKFADGVYSLFIPVGTKRIGFRHNDFMPGTIDFSAFGLTVESGMVYSVGLQRMDVATMYQYLVINVSPANSLVELDGLVQQTYDGIVSAFVQVGTSHHYKVSAAGMVTEEGDVVVTSSDQRTEVNVSLRDNSRMVKIVAAEGADIYVNDRLAGNGTWSGSLSPGTFKVEARLGGQTISSEVCTVLENVSDVQEFIMEVFNGSANITSTPLNVSISIDGQYMGETPLLKSGIIPGVHQLSATKQGFEDASKTILIERDKITDVSFEMVPTSKTLPEQKEAVKQIGNNQKGQKKLQADADAKPADKSMKSAKNRLFFLGELGEAPGSGEETYGFMVGYADKIGGYAKFRSDFRGLPSYKLDYSSTDPVWDYGYTNGKYRFHLAGGVLYHAYGPLYPYAGLGYGYRIFIDRTVSDGYCLVSDYSYSGLAAEAGIILRFGWFACSFGISGVSFKYGDFDFGIGISF